MRYLILSNPITMKELRCRMRGMRAVLPIVAYLVILSIFVLSQFKDFGSYIEYEELSERGRELGFWLLYAQIFLVLLLAPAYAASAITVEKERETFETMQTTLLTAWDIVTGKVFSGVSYAFLLVLSSLPLLSLSFWLGGFDFNNLFWGFLVIATAGLVVSAIGIFLSTVFTRSYLATGVTYGVIIAGMAGSMLFWRFLTTAYYGYGGGAAQFSWHTIPFFFSFTFNPLFMLMSLDQDSTGFYYTSSLSGANPMISGIDQLLQGINMPYALIHVIFSIGLSAALLYGASYFLFKKSRG